MNETWWVSPEQLIGEQSSVINLPPDGSFLVLGPPGSGKTNLLLLRANFLYLAGYANIVMLVFTRTLQEFLVAGANQYDFPSSRILTSVRWMGDLLRSYGRDAPEAGDFTELRKQLLEATYALVKEKKLGKIYEAILLDEGQDYWPDELKLFRTLSERLFVVADSRQKIYSGEESVATAKAIVDETRILQHHFRNGIRICRLADGIGNDSDGYQAMEPTSNYDEAARPSSIEQHKCSSFGNQIEFILGKLDLQRQAYPDEMIGICCPLNVQVQTVWDAIQLTPFSQYAVLQKGDEHSAFTSESRICVATIHAAKGLEFRALHLAGFEDIRKFAHQRNMAFTAVTRAKTSLSLYHCNALPGFLEGALTKLQPLPKLPSVAAAFGKAKGK